MYETIFFIVGVCFGTSLGISITLMVRKMAELIEHLRKNKVYVRLTEKEFEKVKGVVRIKE